MKHNKIILFSAIALGSATGCTAIDDDQLYLVVKLAEDEPRNVDGAGIVIVAQADGGTALTLDGIGGTFVDPVTGDPTTQLCLAANGGAHTILFAPEMDAEAGRIIGRLWGDKCNGSEPLASSSLFFDPVDAAMEQESTGSTGQESTETDTTGSTGQESTETGTTGSTGQESTETDTTGSTGQESTETDTTGNET